MAHGPLPAIARQHLTEAHKRIKAMYPSAYDINFSVIGSMLNIYPWYCFFEFRNKMERYHEYLVSIVVVQLDQPGIRRVEQVLREHFWEH